MEITREEMINRVAEKANYWKKDVRNVFNALEDVILESFGEVTDDEPISIRILRGFCLQGRVVKQRERIDPRNGNPIICEKKKKTSSKYSDLFKKKIQEQYENKKEKENE